VEECKELVVVGDGPSSPPLVGGGDGALLHAGVGWWWILVAIGDSDDGPSSSFYITVGDVAPGIGVRRRKEGGGGLAH
jgi:hypothetical protein